MLAGLLRLQVSAERTVILALVSQTLGRPCPGIDWALAWHGGAVGVNDAGLRHACGTGVNQA